MNTLHTNALLRVNHRNALQIIDADGEVRGCAPVARMLTPHGGGAESRAEARANARHMVACWNGCIGINPEAVPKLLAGLNGAASALEKALPHLPPDTVAIYVGEWLDEARAAINLARSTT